jgi:pimeloyl-ACP methyl ester carboxylesterase
LTKLVDDLYELLRYLEISQAYIAGHSMGGATTIGFAARYPQMTKAALICNIDGAHLPDDPQRDRADEENTKRNHQFVRERGLADFARNQIATKTVPQFILEDEDQQRAFIERYAHQSLNGYFGVFSPGEPLPWREPSLKEAARSLRMPVAIIAGSEDRLRPGAESMHKHIPHSHFVLIENAPHDSMNARPDAFNKGFLEFLENLESGRSVAGNRIL